METVILALQREPGEGWGMNIGRRGEGGAFVVTSIKPGGAASRGPAAPAVGDELTGVAPAAGGFVAVSAASTGAEMKAAFGAAGDACQLRVRRERPEAAKPTFMARFGGARVRRRGR